MHFCFAFVDQIALMYAGMDIGHWNSQLYLGHALQDIQTWLDENGVNVKRTSVYYRQLRKSKNKIVHT